MTTQCAEEKVWQYTESLPLQPRRARVAESVWQRIDQDCGQAIPGKFECPALPRRRFAWPRRSANP
jgi:hypothetical protein